jgi:hypothetical protein
MMMIDGFCFYCFDAYEIVVDLMLIHVVYVPTIHE